MRTTQCTWTTYAQDCCIETGEKVGGQLENLDTGEPVKCVGQDPLQVLLHEIPVVGESLVYNHGEVWSQALSSIDHVYV
jgi:hypothetical protein